MKRSLFALVSLLVIWNGVACSESAPGPTNSPGNQNAAADLPADTKGTKDMSSEKILRGVPKAYYGAGGVTPFPICLKAVSDYLGDELDYTYAIVACGGAFRFAWDTTKWNAGNVDIMLAYGDAEAPFRQGIMALGREFRMLWRAGSPWHPTGTAGKEDYKAFIKEQIDRGRPVISLGPVGPGEAGIITGYRDGGDTLLGWSVFQDWACKRFSDEGYFITDTWWDKENFHGVMALGDIVGPRLGVKPIVQQAIAALEGRQEGNYAKGVAAYDAWKAALQSVTESDFSVTQGGFNDDRGVMMCHGDTMDCLVDGRTHAQIFFAKLASENPDQPLYAEIAEQFDIVATVVRTKIPDVCGGWERGPAQIKALAQPETRRQICEYIDEMKAADEKALALMKELLTTI